MKKKERKSAALRSFVCEQSVIQRPTDDNHNRIRHHSQDRNGKFIILSREERVCPNCGGELRVKDSVPRKRRDRYSKKTTYMIRRLRCKTCKRIHRELPDFLLPYKRYDEETIESVIDKKVDDCTASPSTIQRWRSWNKRSRLTLKSLVLLVQKKIINLLTERTLLEETIQRQTGWLKLTAKMIVNGGYKVPT